MSVHHLNFGVIKVIIISILVKKSWFRNLILSCWTYLRGAIEAFLLLLIYWEFLQSQLLLSLVTRFLYWSYFELLVARVSIHGGTSRSWLVNGLSLLIRDYLLLSKAMRVLDWWNICQGQLLCLIQLFFDKLCTIWDLLVFRAFIKRLWFNDLYFRLLTRWVLSSSDIIDVYLVFLRCRYRQIVWIGRVWLL